MRSIECESEVPGWRLHFCRLLAEPGHHEGTLRLAIGGTLAAFHGRFAEHTVEADPIVQSVRQLIARTGVDPKEHPPASEWLAERLLDGEEFPRSSPSGDLCRLLTLKTLVPWMVADCSGIRPPLRFRLGRQGETGRFGATDLPVEGWPLLLDAAGILGSPLGIGVPDPADDAEEVLLACFQPAEMAEIVAAKAQLARFMLVTWAFRFLEERAVGFGR